MYVNIPGEITEQILQLIIDFFLLIKYDEKSNVPSLLNDILKTLFQKNKEQRDPIVQQLLSKLSSIQNYEILQGIIWLLGEYSSPQTAVLAFQKLQ